MTRTLRFAACVAAGLAFVAAFTVAIAVASARPARADDGANVSAEDRVRVECDVSRPEAYVGEPVRVQLRVLFDAAWFEAHAVRVFQRPLDVPVRVDAPWLRDVPGTLALAATGESAATSTASVVVNGDAGTARRLGDVTRDGRRWTAVEIERRFVPSAPGELALAAPTLRFTWAPRFTEDLFDSRVPVDPRDAAVAGTASRVVVRALPETGRPPGFAGAVGRFRVRADAAPLVVETGATVRLAFHIEGEGNLAAFDAPSLGSPADVHVVGTLDDRGDPHRTIAYELAPLREGTVTIPAVSFAFFDTTPPAAFRVVRTDPIPLTVRPGARPSPVAPAHAPEPDGGPSPAALAAFAALAAVAAAAVVVAARRRSRRAALRPDDVRARDAAAALRAALAAGSEPSAAFAEFLAAHLRCAPAAVVSRDLAARLAAAGASAELAARAAARLDALVAARYSGAAPGASAADDVLRVADELQTALGPRE